MGVASNRVDVRRAAATAERALERLAEPLSALLLPADAWPAALLDEAWLEVIRNAAHDSICACSVDEVCDAVLHRFAEARQIAEGLTQRAVETLGGNLSLHGPVAVNPSHRARSGLVTITVDSDAVTEHGQVVGSVGGDRLLWTLPAANAGAVLRDVIEWTARALPRRRRASGRRVGRRPLVRGTRRAPARDATGESPHRSSSRRRARLPRSGIT